MKITGSFHLYAAMTILFWSMAYVATRLALPYFSGSSLGFLRYFTASCTLAAVAALMKVKAPARKDWVRFAASGATGFFLYVLAFNKGSESVTASTASVVIATAPILTALLALLFYGEKPSSVQWVAMAVEFSGILVLALTDGFFSRNAGIFWLLGAALCFSIYNLLQRSLAREYTPLSSTTCSIFAGTAMLAVFAPSAVTEALQAPPKAFLYLAVLGVFSSAAAYVSWSKALEKADSASAAGNYMFLTPFLTTLLGFAFAGEKPGLPTLAGGALILSGMLIFNWGARKKGG